MVNTGTHSGKAAFAVALAAAAMGSCVLTEWCFDIELIKRVVPGSLAMNPASGMMFVLAGISLALFLLSPSGRAPKARRWILTARFCAFVVALIGLVKLAGILSGLDLRVDQWIFASRQADGFQLPGPIAPNTALNFLLFGGALLLADARKPSVRFCVEFSVVMAGLGALVAVLGYAYQIESFYRLGAFIPMTLPGAVGFLLLTVAFLLSHTDGGLLAVFAGDSVGGTMARRLLPAAILVPAVLGWLTLRGERASWYEEEFGQAMFALGNILAFTFLVSWSARGLFSADVRRKKAEEAMRQSEERFSGAFEYAPIGVALTAPDGRWLQVNRALCEMVGYSESALLHRTFQEITHADDLKASMENVRQLLAGEIGSYQMEKRYLHADGHVVTALLSASAVRDGQGKALYVIAQIQDITERKRAEGELNWKTAFLEAQVNSSIDGILVIDQEGRQSLQNQRFVELLKIPQPIAEEKTDENRLRWVTDMTKNPEQFAERVRYLYDHPAETSRDEVELKDGTILDRYSSPVVGKDGKYYGRIWTFRDITEGKRLEAQLAQSKKMETVGKLAGGVAHEFNSIMTAIIGQSDLLLADLPPANPMSENAREIRQAAERAAVLTRQLLAYGRKQILDPEILDLNALLAGMESTLHHLMGRGVDVRFVTGMGLGTVKVDAGQIEQVIMNMALNAADAMPKGGKLTVETTGVVFDAEDVSRFPELQAGEYVMLAITDNGPGMSEEIKARVFDPFFSTKAVGQGTGLGLSTCYGIIKQSGGHISVYSELGRGTTFKIYLPLAKAEMKLPVTRPESNVLPRGMETILLVEDDPALREMAATLLGRLGYTILTAANGVEALHRLQSRPAECVDLLYTDIVMPEMGGEELAARVRALYPQTRILFTSAYTENAIVHQGVLTGDVALLQKPFTPSALAHKLRKLLDQPAVPASNPALARAAA